MTNDDMIVDSLKDRDFNDDGIPDMYLVTGPDGKTKQFAWSNPEAKAMWDKYVRYCKKEDTYFLDQAAVMVDILKEMRKQTSEMMAHREASNELSQKINESRNSMFDIESAIRDLGGKIGKIKISLF